MLNSNDIEVSLLFIDQRNVSDTVPQLHGLRMNVLLPGL